jgi:outer membrane receptor for ferrienterochelin and colicins
MDLVFYQWIKMILGATYMDVSKPKTTPTRKFYRKISATWAVSYRINKLFLDVDYTGNLYAMRLPLWVT